MDEAVQFVGYVLRHSYTERFELGNYTDRMTLLPDHWRIFVDAIRGGTVRDLSFRGADFSALDDNAFVDAVGFRGLQSLMVYRSIVPSGLVTNDLIRSSVANDLPILSFSANISIDSPPRFSVEAVMDFFFRAKMSSSGKWYSLELDGTSVTDTFLIELFERHLSSAVPRTGSLKLSSASKQNGLSAYARFLVPGGTSRIWDATYRFPSTRDDDLYHEVDVSETSAKLFVKFRRAGCSAS